MTQNPSEESAVESASKKKYQIAGYGFLSLNILYFILAWVFLPPFNIGLSAIASVAAVLALIVYLTTVILKCKRRWVQALALIYAARGAYAIYSLSAGDTFQAVPYFIPCLLITFYLLGRAGWDWP